MARRGTKGLTGRPSRLKDKVQRASAALCSADAMNQPVRPPLQPIRIGHSACPHDCPSTCALEVEVLDDRTIGRVRGAPDNAYTAGVICAKVARYAERIHHPDRLTQPLRRTGPKGSGSFEPISWDDALDLVAEKFLDAEAALRRAVGLALLLRRHHGPRAARRHPPPAPRQEILGLPFHHLRQRLLHRLCRRHRPDRRPRSARDGEIRSGRDLGHQSGEHPGQRDDARDPRPQGARRQDRRGRRLHERHDGAGRSRRDGEARHRRGARLRGDALPVPRRQGGLGLSRQIHRRAARAGSACAQPRSAMGGGDHRLPGRDHRGIRPPRRRDQARVFPAGLRLLALAQRAGQHARGKLHPGDHRRLAARGRRRVPQQRRHLPLGQVDDRRSATCATRRCACSTSRASARSSPATARR